MIDREYLKTVVEEWLRETDYFLVDLTVSEDNRIVVVIDCAEGVWIDDCASLSRHIEAHLDRDKEDFDLEVGSAGLGQPFKVPQQWQMHVGKTVITQLKDGRKLTGTLKRVGDDDFDMEVEVKVKPEGAKRAKKELQTLTFTFAEVASTRYSIKTK
ncbi:MAG: ribosome assembly cofactor RimP [Prevotellaceae bacterium]|nr:ribosome assembly cofactor RimP [Prevotellaceae bacterium]